MVDEEEDVYLMRVEGGTTLPIDVSSEWTRGFALLNSVISELEKDTYVENYIDDEGVERRRTHVNNNLLPFMRERRQMLELIWKLMGGQNAIKSETDVLKKVAGMIFEIGKDPSFREKRKDDIKEVIEAEFDSDD